MREISERRPRRLIRGSQRIPDETSAFFGYSQYLEDDNRSAGGLSRISVAIDSDLLERFDTLISIRGYTNRSEAFRDLIRAEFVAEYAKQPDHNVVGSVTLLYDHHVRLLGDRLTDLQHEAHHLIRSTLHVHLDHHNCLEIIVLQGKMAEVEKIANALISMKGVQHGKLTVTSPNSIAP